MITYFSEKDLADFGRFLLSNERNNFFIENYSENDNIPLEERLSDVYDSDIKNFLKKVDNI